MVTETMVNLPQKCESISFKDLDSLLPAHAHTHARAHQTTLPTSSDKRFFYTDQSSGFIMVRISH